MRRTECVKSSLTMGGECQLCELVMRVLEPGPSRGPAFPSSHVAASVVAALCALRVQGKLGWLVSALAVGLGLGTVYGGYRYGVGMAAGVGTGLVAAQVGHSLEAQITRRSATPR